MFTSRNTRSSTVVLLLALGCALAASAGGATAGASTAGGGFVKRAGAELRLDGREFRFAGSNNYYPIYKSAFMVDDLLETAKAQGFDVMRVWGSLDIGDPADSSTWIGGGPKEGVYLQYWDAAAGRPAYNDGPNGIQKLDYVVAKAGELGLRLVIPFVNNWNDFGGIDQYVGWRDLSAPGPTRYHDSFYTDPVIRGWYRDWISHVLNHRNTITGVLYKDDPTVMTWELGNEPRCLSAGFYPRSPDCTTETLVRWADEMSRHIKRIDRNHLVSVGDEGFFCRRNGTHWTENCGEGVDTEAFTRLRDVDVMSFHLYPDHWGTTPEWGTDWIKRHFATAKRLGKPAMLGEFGLRDRSIRNPVYKEWLDTAFRNDAAGVLYWILSGRQDDGSLYPDYDGFTVYCPSPVCTTFANFGRQQEARRPLEFAPVADHDSATTEFETPVTLPAMANDVSYSSPLRPRTLDLDPAAAGRQTALTVSGGTFAAADDGTVAFTPSAGFFGTAAASYVVQDKELRSSNEATLTVRVNRPFSPAIHLFSFEGSLEGWARGRHRHAHDLVGMSSDGTSSLELAVTGEGWFGGALPAAVDSRRKSAVKLDLQTLGSQTYRKFSIQVGDGFTWCEAATDGNTPQGRWRRSSSTSPT